MRAPRPPARVAVLVTLACAFATADAGLLDALFGAAAPNGAGRTGFGPDSARATRVGALPMQQLFSLQPYVSERLEEGRKLLEDAERQGEHFECWREANEYLAQQGCKALTYETRARIAVKLTNCHLAKSGLRDFPCSEVEDVARCTRRLGEDALAFGTFNTFFSHAESICFYVQQSYFQESAERAVHSLYRGVVETAEHLARFAADSADAQQQLEGLVRAELASLSKTIEAQAMQLQERIVGLSVSASDIERAQRELVAGQKRAEESLTASLENQQRLLRTQAEAELRLSSMQEKQTEAASALQALAAGHEALKRLQGSAVSCRLCILRNFVRRTDPRDAQRSRSRRARPY
jgi:hypothetical protein